ncbi:MAG: Dipeptidylaminopeptidase/acylaminoacyl-peptidase [Candidatus Saccharibacteria bacterium]|nr:Dipeptidylaminopeptidase/acylaminoacyl-peptidase [Candidatus Saccharibacteria bacterium]
MSRKQLGAVFIAIAAVGALGGWLALSAVSRPAALKPLLSPTPTPPGPLAIETIRKHQLTPGPVTIESDLGWRGGCHIFDVSYRSDDLKVYALMTVPGAGKPDGGYPTIVLAHGYIRPTEYQTDGGDYTGWTSAYCNAGYAVIKPDFRGHGRSEGTATGGHFSSNYTYDLLNLTASLNTVPDLNPSRVAWFGHSMGAHVALRGLVADHGQPVKAAVLVSGVVGSLQDIIYNWRRGTPPASISPQRARILEEFGDPEENSAAWKASSAINYVDAIKSPVDIHPRAVIISSPTPPTARCYWNGHWLCSALTCSILKRFTV